MGHGYGKIYSPVDITDITSILGISDYDIGNLNSNIYNVINPWAKKKPVRFPDLGDNENYWKAYDGLCGFQIPSYNSIGTIYSGFLFDIINNKVSWVYVPPYGGDAAPFRYLDYDGYYHYAIEPISSEIPNNVYVDAYGKVSFNLELNTDDSVYNLRLSDFSKNGLSFTKYYLGVVLVRDSSYIIATSTSPGTMTVTLNNMQSYSGTYRIAFFLSSQLISQGGATPSGSYVPLYIRAKEISVNASGTLYSITAVGSWNYNNTLITYDLYLENNSSGGTNLNNVTSFLVRTSGSTKPENGEIVRSEVTGTVYVGPKATVHLSDYTFSYNRIYGYTYWLGASAQGVPAKYFQIEDYS